MEQDICSLHSIYQASAESPEFIRVHLLQHIKALGNASRKFLRYRCDAPCLPRCASRQPPCTPLSNRISSPTPKHAVARLQCWSRFTIALGHPVIQEHGREVRTMPYMSYRQAFGAAADILDKGPRENLSSRGRQPTIRSAHRSYAHLRDRASNASTPLSLSRTLD